MARTTSDLVKKIIETDAQAVAQSDNLTSFIEIANMMVTRIVAPSGPYPYTESDLTQIETWLAAHFYTIRDNRATSEAAGPVSASYSVTTALNLASSMYGQTAMLLDTNGALAQASKRAEQGKSPLAGDLNKGKVDVAWLGQ